MAYRMHEDQWYINENDLNISFFNYSIILSIDSYKIKMDIIKEVKPELTLKFSSFEEAIKFTEEEIGKNSSITIEEIQEKYNALNPMPKVLKRTNHKNINENN